MLSSNFGCFWTSRIGSSYSFINSHFCFSDITQGSNNEIIGKLMVEEMSNDKLK